MTRIEEIQKLIDEEMGIDNYGSSDYQVGVCDGVRLADKTMIDKACEWLDNYLMEIGYPDDWLRDSLNIKSGKERFRKAMEK